MCIRDRLYIAGAALAGVAVFLIIKKVTDGIWYLPNYAYFYLLLFTVLLQYLALSMTLKRFMKAKLDAFVAGLKELNRTRVAMALQVEKESMEKAAKSEQLKVDLISNVSHDLKTPLTSMVGYIERCIRDRIIILGCLYDYFGGLQEKQMQDELTLAAAGLEQSGEVYLTDQHLESKRFRLTWICLLYTSRCV